MTDSLSEAQDFQMIGQASPELDAIAAEKNGWQQDVAEEPIEQFTAHDYSFWADRANYQALGREIPNMASYQQPSTAAQPVEPFTYREEN